MFSWYVTTPGSRRGACGVTSELAEAVHGVTEAIHAIGGTRGVIQICRLASLGPHYVYGAVVARAERDEASDAVVWRPGPVG